MSSTLELSTMPVEDSYKGPRMKGSDKEGYTLDLEFVTAMLEEMKEQRLIHRWGTRGGAEARRKEFYVQAQRQGEMQAGPGGRESRAGGEEGAEVDTQATRGTGVGRTRFGGWQGGGNQRCKLGLEFVLAMLEELKGVGSQAQGRQVEVRSEEGGTTVGRRDACWAWSL